VVGDPGGSDEPRRLHGGGRRKGGAAGACALQALLYRRGVLAAEADRWDIGACGPTWRWGCTNRTTESTRGARGVRERVGWPDGVGVLSGVGSELGSRAPDCVADIMCLCRRLADTSRSPREVVLRALRTGRRRSPETRSCGDGLAGQTHRGAHTSRGTSTHVSGAASHLTRAWSNSSSVELVEPVGRCRRQNGGGEGDGT